MFQSARTSQSLAPTIAVVVGEIVTFALWLAPMLGGPTAW
jgi:hypothetical protein